jgi:glycosyltransferase involved in cell wall biosynthesis
MPTTEAIFIFTKDRPETLSKTLESIQPTQYKKFVIDDSVSVANQATVLNLCKKYPDCYYLGKSEFQKFVSDCNIQFPEFSFLLRELGSTEWNLGYARNFAMMYSKAEHFEKVLFTDDDIQVPNLNLIPECRHH